MQNNIGNIANLFQRKGIIHSRLERVKREGSPNFIYPLPAIAAGVTDTIHVPTQFPLSRKYQPLDSLEIVNNEAANPLIVIINAGDVYYCPAGTIRSISGTGIALWTIDIVNQGGGVTTLGQVYLTLKKEAMTIDKWAAER